MAKQMLFVASLVAIACTLATALEPSPLQDSVSQILLFQWDPPKLTPKRSFLKNTLEVLFIRRLERRPRNLSQK
uniref:Uncharacterized protein n=1 Tax=Salix viminalis TaxID=40686 RepID=A0A6N2KCK5_SALVM